MKLFVWTLRIVLVLMALNSIFVLVIFFANSSKAKRNLVQQGHASVPTAAGQ